jgi:hypothetical protein
MDICRYFYHNDRAFVKAYLKPAGFCLVPDLKNISLSVTIDKIPRPALSFAEEGEKDRMRAVSERGHGVAGKNRRMAAVGVAVILFSLYLLFSLGAGFHHHADGLTHDDCPSCLFSSLPLVNAASFTSLPFSLNTAFLEPAEGILRLSAVHSPARAIRAPPA